MVKKVIFISIIMITSLNAALTSLVRTIPNQTNFDTNIPNNWNANDDDSKNVPIGFSFPFNGNNYTSLYINSNGMLSFTADKKSRTYNNKQLLETSEPPKNFHIFPYWDDIYRGNGTIRYGTLDDNGANERFVVEWRDVAHYNDRNKKYTFQVVLYPNGSIRFRYDPNKDADGTSCNGSDKGATIGVREDDSHYNEYSYDNLIDQTKDVLYYRPADMKITKRSCIIYDPVNLSINPKRIPGATIRYALQVSNSAAGIAKNVLVDDSLNAGFDHDTIRNLQVKNGLCDCIGVASASNNGVNGTGNGVNPVKLDFGMVAGGSVASPTSECGYFEVNIK